METAATIVEPPPERYADEWARDHRKLPPGSAEKGQYRPERTPYVIPIARAFDRYYLRRITFAMARQMAKTNGVVFNVMGKRLDDDPVPMIYVGPTQTNIDDVIEPKVDFMLTSTESLRRKTARGKKNKKHSKIVSGVSVRFAWAGSDSTLKSDAAGVVFVDEVDGIEAERKVAGEGTVVDMAEAILSSFPEGVMGITSTPTHGHVDAARHPVTGLEHWVVSEEVISAVWTYWQEGSRHEWAWPCPHCLDYWIPRSKHLGPVSGVTPEEAEAQGHLACPNCGGKVEDRHRGWANDRGLMVAPGQKPAPYHESWGCLSEGGPGVTLYDYVDGTEPGSPILLPWGDFHLSRRVSHASFWVSGMANFSQKNSYGVMASKLVLATKSGLPQRLQGVYNTNFGELYLQRGDTPASEEIQILGRQEGYRLGEVPERVTVVTLTADVSDHEIQWTVRGWVPETDFESYLIDRGVVFGETDQVATWAEFKLKVLLREYDGLRIVRAAIDSGHRAEAVYQFCKENESICIPTKGKDHMDAWWKASRPEVDANGRIERYGLVLWHLNTDITKSWVISRIRTSISGDVVWHLPSNIDLEYCKQVSSESRIIDKRGQVSWIRHRANHFLDCEAQQFFLVNQIAVPKERPAKVKKEDKKPFRNVFPAQDPYLQ